MDSKKRAVRKINLSLFAKTGVLFIPAAKFTAVLPIHGITAISEWSLRTMLRKHGGRSSYKNPPTMSV